eukprot:3176048-Amphidinium_carterae.1
MLVILYLEGSDLGWLSCAQEGRSCKISPFISYRSVHRALHASVNGSFPFNLFYRAAPMLVLALASLPTTRLIHLGSLLAWL